MKFTNWNTFYTGTEDDINASIAQINSNCGFPDGYCETWAMPQQAYQQNFWYFPMPSPNGYREMHKQFSQEEMISGVVNVEQQQYNPDWLPPNMPPGKGSNQ